MSKITMLSLAVAASFIFSHHPKSNAANGSVCERFMEQYSKQYGVPLGILYAVGLTETGRKGSLQPYALNVDGRAIFSENAAV